MEPLKYFAFNKTKDYLSGYLEHVQAAGQGLILEEIQGSEGQPLPFGQHGTFISRPLDSGEEGNLWRRALVESVGYGDDSIRFFFYCSDSSKIDYQGRTMEWDEFIQNPAWDAAEKHRVMAPYLALQELNPQDILLYHARGRYLWMEVQMFCQAQVRPQILNIKIYANSQGFWQYLPRQYQQEPEHGFLGRFLAMFEAVYRETDDRLRLASGQMEPKAAEPEFLQWMAKLAGIPKAQLWPEEKLRPLLSEIVKKHFIRGTREYMEYIVEAFTGEKPLFVEYEEIERYKGSPEVYRKLVRQYAHNPYAVNLLIREQAIPGKKGQAALRQVIEEIKPAHLTVRIILLKPCIHLGQNVYVGMNSVLGACQKTALDGRMAVPARVGMAGPLV